MAFSFGGCITKENFDYKVTVVPEYKSSAVTPASIKKAAEIISLRLNNSFGISKESMKLDIKEDQISITVYNADTSKIASIGKVITGFARLELWETYENPEIIGYLTKVNSLLREMKTGTVGNNASPEDEFVFQNPLFGVLKPMITEKGEPMRSCLIGLASETDTAKVDRYLQLPEVKAIFPTDLKFMWSQKPYNYGPSKGLYELHAIKVTSQDGRAPLDGSVIISAKTVSGSSESDFRIGITMSAEGASSWAGITRRNINRCIAVVLNGYVRSYPRVQAEIAGGNTEISGDFTRKEANDFVEILRSGQLPFRLKIL